MLKSTVTAAPKLLWTTVTEPFGSYFAHAKGAAQAKLLAKNLDQVAKNVIINNELPKAGKALEDRAIKPFHNIKYMRPEGHIEFYVAWFKYENYLEATKLLETIKIKFPKFDFANKEHVEEAAELIKQFGELAELLKAIVGAEADVTTLYKRDQKDGDDKVL